MIQSDAGFGRTPKLFEERGRRLNTPNSGAGTTARDVFDRFQNIYYACPVISAREFPRRRIDGCPEFLCKLDGRLDFKGRVGGILCVRVALKQGESRKIVRFALK